MMKKYLRSLLPPMVYLSSFLVFSCNTHSHSSLHSWTQSSNSRLNKQNKKLLTKPENNRQAPQPPPRPRENRRIVIPNITLSLAAIPSMIYFGSSTDTLGRLSFTNIHSPDFSPMQILTAPLVHYSTQHLNTCTNAFISSGTLLECITDRNSILNAYTIFLLSNGIFLLLRLPPDFKTAGLSSFLLSQKAYTATLMLSEFPSIQKIIKYFFPNSPKKPKPSKIRLILYQVTTINYLYSILSTATFQHLLKGTTPCLEEQILSKKQPIIDHQGLQAATLLGLFVGLSQSIKVNLPSKKGLRDGIIYVWNKSLQAFTCCRKRTTDH